MTCQPHNFLNSPKKVETAQCKAIFFFSASLCLASNLLPFRLIRCKNHELARFTFIFLISGFFRLAIKKKTDSPASQKLL